VSKTPKASVSNHLQFIDDDDDETCLAAIFQDNPCKLEPECLHSGFYWKSTKVVMTTGNIARAKLLSSRHHQKINAQLVTDWMPLLLPNQHCQSTVREKVSHSMDLLTQAHLGVFQQT